MCFGDWLLGHPDPERDSMKSIPPGVPLRRKHTRRVFLFAGEPGVGAIATPTSANQAHAGGTLVNGPKENEPKKAFDKFGCEHYGITELMRFRIETKDHMAYYGAENRFLTLCKVGEDDDKGNKTGGCNSCHIDPKERYPSMGGRLCVALYIVQIIHDECIGSITRVTRTLLLGWFCISGFIFASNVMT